MLIKDFISFLTLDLHGRILSQKPDAELDADLQDDTYRMSGEGVHVGNFRYFIIILIPVHFLSTFS